MNQSKPQEFRFWKALMPLADLLGEFSAPRSDFQKYSDLSIRQMKALKTVWYIQEKNPQGTTLKNLAEEIRLTPGSASELVDSLVRRNLLARVQNPKDRREVRITLTEESITVINACIRNMDMICLELLKELPESDRPVLISGLETILNNLNKRKEKSK